MTQKTTDNIETAKQVVGILLAIGITVGNMVFDKEISLNLLAIPAMLLGISFEGLGNILSRNSNKNE